MCLKEVRKNLEKYGEKYLKRASERNQDEKASFGENKVPSTEQKKTPEFIISSWRLTVTAVPSSYSERVVFYS